jgi:hypothetical protein
MLINNVSLISSNDQKATFGQLASYIYREMLEHLLVFS